MKKNSFIAQLASGLLLAVAALSLTACANIIYREPEFQYAGRSVPPSGLLQRVLATYTLNGSSGGAEILDGLRDTRSNVQDTIPTFFIKGYSAAQPNTILNFPEQQKGYILSLTDGVLGTVDYATESSTGSAATFGSYSPSAAAAFDGSRFAGVVDGQGILDISAGGSTYALNLPNVAKVFINQGNSAILATVLNSDTLYRVITLPNSTDPVLPPNYVDCEPLQLPKYCVVPVPGTYSRPTNVYFSLDGTTAYVLNCGPECGGTSPSSVTLLNEGSIQIDNRCISGIAANLQPLCTQYTGTAKVPSPVATLPVTNPIPVPGGATVAVGNGNNLYLAGQQLQTSGANAGLFAGYLSVLNLSTYTVSAPVSISDGTHTRILFADDNTLWIAASQCANGVRKATGLNYNCLTRAVYDATTGAITSAGLVPNVTPGGTTTVSYPNTNLDPYYYGSATGLCWIQDYHKVYVAYGGQIHVFKTTSDITEIDNEYVTVQGTVLDVAYMDAITNNSN